MDVLENVHHKLCMKWEKPSFCERGAFQIFRKENEFSDVTLAFEDGPPLEAHRVILAVCSPVFRNLLKRSKRDPIVYMRGVRSEDMAAIVDFLYYGEANVAQEDLKSFLALAEELKIKGFNAGQKDENHHKTWLQSQTVSNVHQDLPDYDSEGIEGILEVANTKTRNSVQPDILVDCKTQNEIRNWNSTEEQMELQLSKGEAGEPHSAKAKDSNMAVHGDLAGQSWEMIRRWQESPPSFENLMRLPKAEMTTLGRFPAWDPLTLVSCNVCGKKVKVEALEFHVEKKHNAESEMSPLISQTHTSQLISATSIKIFCGNKSKSFHIKNI